MITSCQIRAARALINWSARELAEKSKVGVATVRRMELADGIPSSNAQTLDLIIKNHTNPINAPIINPNTIPKIEEHLLINFILISNI
jgi:transcriptional regulator with XRE-family HTH domain